MKNNLDNKINLLYDFNYSKSFKNKVNIDTIDLGNISLDNIKFLKKDNDTYRKILDEILTGNFKLVNHNSKNNTLILKRYSDNFSVSLFITPYKSLKSVQNTEDKNNNDAIFSYVLSQLVLNKKTKHILLPIINIDVEFQQLSNILKNYEAYNDYLKHIENETISNILSVRVKENFFSGMLFKDYMGKKQCNIKPMLFQIIHTLAVLQKEFKGFRHNMLDYNSIYIYEKENKIEEYIFNNKKYYVPNDGIDIKITNFFNSIIPGYFTKKSKVPFSDNTEINNYFDLHYFLNRLIHDNNFNTECHDETSKFLEKIIPKKYRSKQNHYYMERFIDHVEPAELLNDEYFKVYTKKKESKEELSENDYYMGNINVKMDSDNETYLGKQKSGNYYKGIRIITNNRNNKNILNRKEINYEMSGGGYFNLPNAPIKNSPFVSNEQKNNYKKNKDNEKKKEIPKPEVIAEQKIVKNPIFKPTFKPKEKKTWEDGYKKFPDKQMEIPQGKIHTPSNTEVNTTESDKKEYKPREFKPREDRPPREFKPREDRPPREFRPQYETKNIKDEPLLAEQKVYQPKVPPGGSGHKHPMYNYPAYITTDDQKTLPPPFVQDYDSYPWPHSVPLKKVNEIPLQKIYNINLGGGDQNHTVLNSLYEDIIPGEPFQYSMIKTLEREEIKNFIRNSVLIKGDYDDITLQKSSGRSLLSYFRILHFNPYGNGNKNPYTNIPYNFLIYNMAYPVKFEDNRVEAARNAMGFNLRIYNLSYGAANFKNTKLKTSSGRDLDSFDFNVWREIHYYETITNMIINKKVSPNFIQMLFYTRDKDSKIKYNELKNIIDTHKTTGFELVLNNSKKAFENVAITEELKEYFGGNFPKMTSSDLAKDSGLSLLAVTEAPNYSIREWASPLYNKFSARHEMVSTGHHTIDEWRSVLFQILYACFVMEKIGFHYRDFSLDNIFVKDLFVNKSSVNHWKYIIDDYEFYVPNFGFLVLLDSRFKDVDSAGQFKLTGKIFDGRSGDNPTNFMEKVKNIFNSPVFNLPPPEYIKNLLNNIFKDLNTKNIKQTLCENFVELLNNRVGTPLTTSERNNLSVTSFKDITNGKLVVYQKRYEEFIWVIYNGKDETNNKKRKILFIDDNILKNESIFPHSLMNYPSSEPVLQNSKKNMRFDTDSTIETYRI
jgi:hypothetical protein